MATSKYTIAPPSVARLLHEYGDYDAIPDTAWREFIHAMAYWSRCWLMYAGPADDPPKPKRSRRREASEKGAIADEIPQIENAKEIENLAGGSTEASQAIGTNSLKAASRPP
jgi:hypothetical protein